MDIGSVQNSPTAVPTKVERTQSATAGNAVEGALEQRVAQDSVADQSVSTASSPQASREDVEEAVATIQDFVQTVRRALNFSLEEGTGRVVVKVTDSGSGDVIRQIPSEEALQLAENLSEVRSLLFKAEA